MNVYDKIEVYDSITRPPLILDQPARGLYLWVCKLA